MGKLTKKLSEYFLGAESRKFYREERNFYRDFLEDKNQQNKALAGSVAAEVLELTLGKALPNALSFASLANIALTGDASYLKMLAVGEGVRAFSHLLFKQYQKLSIVDRYIMKEDQRNREFTEMIYNLADSNTEGEEWKDN